jgi:hypothetical protein
MDMGEMRHEAAQYSLDTAIIHVSRRQQEEKRPHPRHCPQGDLEAGRPIYPDPRRILFDPAFHLSDGDARVIFVFRIDVRARQRDQVLMTVDLVNDFRDRQPPVCR